jgi:TATA-box binding protein (TBP) (component of TFIID and TFIIIB)
MESTRLAEICRHMKSGDGDALLESLNTFVQNRVIHVRLEIPGYPEARFDVKATTKQLKHAGAKYNSSRFRAMRRKLVNPRGGMHTFDEGNTIVTGTKNLLVTEYIVNAYVDALRKRKANFPAANWTRVVPKSWTQVNVVSNMSLPFGVDLRAIHGAAKKIPWISTDYTPRKFTGLIMKVDVPSEEDEGSTHGITGLIFDTGSLVVTGGKKMVYTRAAAQIILPVLMEHRVSARPSVQPAKKKRRPSVQPAAKRKKGKFGKEEKK